MDIRYYTEAKGHRWAMMAVDHTSLDRAIADAERTSKDCFHVNVYRVDLKNPNDSQLLGVARRGAYEEVK